MKKIAVVSLSLFALALSSCTYIDFLTTSRQPRTSTSEEEPSTSKGPSTIVASNYENLSKHSVYYESTIPTSTPKSKYLVLPIWFNDSNDLIEEDESKESIKEKLTIAFGGSEEETGWHSVKTYYAAESKGKKEFDVVVADWYDCGLDSEVVAGDQEDEIIGENTENIVYHTVTNFFKTHPEESRTDYDSDGDGYLDAIAVIYAIPDYKSDFDFLNYYGQSASSLTNLWAYVYWLADPDYQNVNRPGPNAYLWASYDFATVSDKNAKSYPVKVDAHAYIHETGHLFGLDDYYDYTGGNRPAGSFSMQDYNVGGHDPFSVLSLGWGEPYVPTQTETITLEPFQTSNKVILLSNNYEDSVFDEYLLIEYYTPTGLNKLDCDYSYEGNYPQGPKVPGIRLWHVDARLAYKLGRTTNYSYSPSQITNKIDTAYYYNMACRNNTFDKHKSSSYFSPLKDYPNFKDYRLLDLIRKGDIFRISLREKSELDSIDLFYAGESFDMRTYSHRFVERGKLDSGSSFKWSFSVNAITEESATITVTRS